MNESKHNQRTRIKICGIKDEQALATAIHAGADAIGLMLYEGSRRYIDIASAQLLTQNMPAFVVKVAVIVNASEAFVHEVIAKLRPDYLQFHGDESAQFCRQFNYPYIRAFGMRNDTDLQDIANTYYDARALLVDTYSKDAYGGIGEAFNWDLLCGHQVQCHLPIILAGGLNIQNIAQAIEKVGPFAVDVSSGVEHNGHKDSGKIQAFCREVRRVNTD